jgi:hypothetical protein
MSREPCSITDDPYNDYSDYIERTGVYKSNYDSDAEDREYEEQRQKEIENASPLELYAQLLNSLTESTDNAK